MSNSLPDWIQWLSALTPPAVAIFVAVIAYLQWRTAHQKVVLELFERRLDIFEEVAAVVRQIMSHGSAKNAYKDDDEVPDAFFALNKATRHSSLLFGSDIELYLKEMRENLASIALAEDMMNVEGEDRSAWISQKYTSLKFFNCFYDKFPKLCEPYMRMDEKRVRTPIRWLTDAVGRGRTAPELKRPTPNPHPEA